MHYTLIYCSFTILSFLIEKVGDTIGRIALHCFFFINISPAGSSPLDPAIRPGSFKLTKIVTQLAPCTNRPLIETVRTLYENVLEHVRISNYYPPQRPNVPPNAIND